MLRFLRALIRPDSNGQAGERGESVAADWLRRERGFVIVLRNWRNPRDRREEVDLVCRDGEVLVFVEVKARQRSARVPGFLAVNARKKLVLRRAIEAYLAQLREKPTTFRFDVVEVAFGPDTATAPEVLHFENVPLFSKYFRP